MPVRDDRLLFEMLSLEGAQAGLSWYTVLQKRERYRAVFARFEPQKVARFSAAKLERLANDPGIIRNRLKIKSVVTNAKAFIDVQEEFGAFSHYIWGFVDHQPIVNAPRKAGDYAATSNVSDALSKDLKKRGFKFVGSTIMYAFMQATGMVNDHAARCYRQQEITRSYR